MMLFDRERLPLTACRLYFRLSGRRFVDLVFSHPAACKSRSVSSTKTISLITSELPDRLKFSDLPRRRCTRKPTSFRSVGHIGAPRSYYALRVVETALWGSEGAYWYAFVFSCSASSSARWAGSMHVTPGFSLRVALTLFSLSFACGHGCWGRSGGASEQYVAFRPALFAIGFLLLDRPLAGWKSRGPEPILMMVPAH